MMLTMDRPSFVSILPVYFKMEDCCYSLLGVVFSQYYDVHVYMVHQVLEAVWESQPRNDWLSLKRRLYQNRYRYPYGMFQTLYTISLAKSC